MRSIRRRLGCWTLSILGLLGISGCVMGNGPPEALFSGRQLDAARAIDAGDIERLRAVAAQLEDVNAAGQKGMTLLWYAIQEENFEAITALIELGSKPDEQVVQGIGSALDYTIYNQDLRFLRAILDGGVPANMARESGLTLLQRAAGPGGSLSHVELLVERGANVNQRNSIGGTALSDAISVLKPHIASYLVERGADVNAVKSNGVSAPWSVQTVLRRQQPGSEMFENFQRLRESMIAKGATFPPLSPDDVLERATAQGMEKAPPSLTMLE